MTVPIFVIELTPMIKAAFLNAFRIKKGDVVSLCGAGGKTTLLYRLANEVRGFGYKVLVTTTTKLFMPEAFRYDAIDLSGNILFEPPPQLPRIYFCGTGEPENPKVTSVSVDTLRARKDLFDLILIEADGAAQKSLKGWKSSEPVIPEMTTKTIGVVDIQTLNQAISNQLVHRIERFCHLVGSKPGTMITTEHLAAMISHKNGLFQHARGQRLLFINKVESEQALAQARTLASVVPTTTVIGSLHEGVVYESA